MSDLFGWNTAEFSPCRTWRYVLRRRWQTDGPALLVIMLNPSKADEERSDNTVTKCITFAQDLGFAGLTVANLFAYMATRPADMRQAPDPVGPDNDKILAALAVTHELKVVAWGNTGAYLNRAQEVLQRGVLGDVWCWGVTGSGHPRHPLYLPRSSTLTRFETNT